MKMQLNSISVSILCIEILTVCLDIVGAQRFIGYPDPKLYGHLVSTNSLHLHYGQRVHLDEH